MCAWTENPHLWMEDGAIWAAISLQQYGWLLLLLLAQRINWRHFIAGVVPERFSRILSCSFPKCIQFQISSCQYFFWFLPTYSFTFSMNFFKQIFSNDLLIQKKKSIYYSHIPINYLDLRHISVSNGCGILHLCSWASST